MSLSSFFGSEEEKALKEAMSFLAHKNYAFGNIEIESCNVLKPVSFTNADVVTKPVNKQLEYRASRYTAWSKIDCDTTVVRYDQLFKKELTKDVGLHGIRNINKKCEPAFLAILNFLRGVGDEAKTTAVMAQHLFCHLIPGKEYVIDSRCKFRGLSRVCPCVKNDCKQILKTGCTALGSSETWHGYADIILNQAIAVSVLEKLSRSEDKNDEEMVENTSSFLKDNDDTEEEDGPSEPKRLRTEDDDTEKDDGPSTSKESNLPSCGSSTCSSSNVSICIEVKANKKDSTLSNIHVNDQIIAQTITNAFSQVSKNYSLSGWLIPTLGCTAEHVVVYLYDSKNDVLLQCCQKLPLWGGMFLRIPSIVQIWMLLNFTIFTHKNLADDYELVSSNIHSLAHYRLQNYKNMGCQKDFTNSCENEVDDALSLIDTSGKTAVKKKKAQFDR